MDSENFTNFNFSDLNETIKKYEGMVKNHTQVFFDLEELTDLTNYYISEALQEKSLDVIEYGLSLYPDNADLMVARIKVLCLLEKDDEAVKYVNLLEKIDTSGIDPEEIASMYMIKYIHEGDLEKADAYLHEQMEQLPLRDSLLKKAIYLYFRKKRDKEAGKCIEEYIKLPEVEDEDKEFISRILLRKDAIEGEPNTAIEHTLKELDENPYSCELWIELANFYFLETNIEKALEALDYALAIDPKNLSALERLADIQMTVKDTEGAIDTVKKIVGYNPRSEKYVDILYTYYIEHHWYQDAADLCIQAISAFPADYSKRKATLYFRRSICEKEMGFSYFAFPDITKAIENMGDTPPTSSMRLIRGFCGISEFILRADRQYLEHTVEDFTTAYKMGAKIETEQALAEVFRELEMIPYRLAYDLSSAITKGIGTELYELELAMAYSCHLMNKNDESLEHVLTAFSIKEPPEEDYDSIYGIVLKRGARELERRRFSLMEDDDSPVSKDGEPYPFN